MFLNLFSGRREIKKLEQTNQKLLEQCFNLIDEKTALQKQEHNTYLHLTETITTLKKEIQALEKKLEQKPMELNIRILK